MMHIPAQYLTDATMRQLRADGWVIKCPYFVNGQAVFPAHLRG